MKIKKIKDMKVLKPKEFIQSVLINEIGRMINDHPYISFIVMGIGVEFLGKCIDSELTDWNVPDRSKHDFESAIKTIPNLKKYEPYLTTYKMYSSFRCGLVHAVSPKFKITLSSKNELEHLNQHDGRLNLKVEDFYQDFKGACEHVINIEYGTNDKMNSDFLEIPGDESDSGLITATGFTIGFVS
jgi:hypothetical protein